jgi:heptosyltransferase-2
VKRLAIVAPGWLGDAVMALPAIADVRRAWPDASIAIAARPAVAPLFTLTSEIDEVLTLADDGPAALSGRDAALLLPNSFHAAFIAKRAGIPERWGYATDWRRLLLTRAVPPVRVALHQIDYYQQLVHALGFANGANAPRVDLSLAVRERGAAVLREAGWDGRVSLLALAPGAAFGSAKRWPPSAFGELAAALAEDGVGTVMVGAAADRTTAVDVARAAGDRARIIDLTGRTDVPGLAGVLASCRALVANDSGALHLAAALGVHVTAVFGPTDERLTAPRPRSDQGPRPDQEPSSRPQGPGVSVLTNAVWCRPCMLRECPLDHDCMNGIPMSRVLGETRRML